MARIRGNDLLWRLLILLALVVLVSILGNARVYGSDEPICRLVASYGEGRSNTAALPDLDWDKEEQWVKEVGSKVALQVGVANAQFSIFSGKDAAELNAWAYPDGRIQVTQGMVGFIRSLPVSQQDAALVGVLGHEATHVKERHAKKELKAYRTGLAVGVLGAVLDKKNAKAWLAGGDAVGTASALHTSRVSEYDADKGGVETVFALGLDPLVLVTVFDGLTQRYGKGFTGLMGNLANHPNTDNRSTRIKKLVAEHQKAQGATAESTQKPATKPGAPIFFVKKVVFDNFPYPNQELFRQELKARLASVGGEQVAWGEDYDSVTQAQDQMENGRYKPGASKVGQLNRPTEMWQVTIGATETETEQNARIKSTSARIRTIQVRVRLAFQRIQIAKGSFLPASFIGEGTVTRRIVRDANLGSRWLSDTISYENWENGDREKAGQDAMIKAIENAVKTVSGSLTAVVPDTETAPTKAAPKLEPPTQPAPAEITVPEPELNRYLLELAMLEGELLRTGDSLEYAGVGEDIAPVAKRVIRGVRIAVPATDTQPTIGSLWVGKRAGKVVGRYRVLAVNPITP